MRNSVREKNMESRWRNRITMVPCKPGVFAAPQHNRSVNMGASVTYSRLRSLFRIPVVYAESPSATQIIEERIATQKSNPKIMVSESDINAYLSNETGRDRLKAMYTRSESGQFSTEITYIMQALFNSCGMAFLMASIFTGFRARDEFRIKHQSTVFKTRFRAHRLMNDNIMIAVAKDGMRWATRIAAFIFPFLMVSQSIAVYRNKSSPFEYAAGSAAAGFFVKMNLGLKGGLAGSVIGGTMGLLTGTLIYGLLYASDELQESRHYREVQKLLEEQRELDVMLGRTKPNEETGQSVTNPAV